MADCYCGHVDRAGLGHISTSAVLIVLLIYWATGTASKLLDKGD